jgi:hypothetical protein
MANRTHGGEEVMDGLIYAAGFSKGFDAGFAFGCVLTLVVGLAIAWYLGLMDKGKK